MFHDVFSHTHVLCYFHSRHDTLILFRRVWKSPRKFNNFIQNLKKKRWKCYQQKFALLLASMFGCCKSFRFLATQESAPASQSRVSGSDGCQVAPGYITSPHITGIYIYIHIWACLFLMRAVFSKGRKFDLRESYPRIIPRIIPPESYPRNLRIIPLKNQDYECFFWDRLGLHWPH